MSPQTLEVFMSRFAKGALVAVIATAGLALSGLGAAAAGTDAGSIGSGFGTSGSDGSADSGAVGGGSGAGTTFAIPAGTIVTLCGNGTALLGGIEADCAPASRDGSVPASDGSGDVQGLLAGSVNPLVGVPVTVCGDSLAVLGVANADCAAVREAVRSQVGAGTDPGNAGTAISGEAAPGHDAAAPIGPPISVPITLCGNDVAVLGTAEADCATTQATTQATTEPDGSAPRTDIGDDVQGATPDGIDPGQVDRSPDDPGLVDPSPADPAPGIPVTVCVGSAAGAADTDCAVSMSTQTGRAPLAPSQTVPRSVPLPPGQSGPLSAEGPAPLVRGLSLPRIPIPRADPAPTAVPSAQPSASLTPAVTPTLTPTPTITPTTAGTAQAQSDGLDSLPHTGAVALLAAPVGVALIAGGYLLYRRFRSAPSH
ncbi:MAG: hypothetical protein ACRDPT_04370 [Streptomycetales bacterium]